MKEIMGKPRGKSFFEKINPFYNSLTKDISLSIRNLSAEIAIFPFETSNHIHEVQCNISKNIDD